MNFEKARFTMVNQNIRSWNVSDRRVLDALFAIPREAFVPSEYQEFAYADTGIPLADGQEMMLPQIAARVLQALDLASTDHVLEVGTGSGYLTALIAMLARDVVSIEISPSLHRLATAALAAQGVRNAQVFSGDATTDWDQEAPFDAIAVTGSVPVLPTHFQQQLKENGRLFVVVGKNPVMEARLITRTGPEDWKEDVLFETSLPPLRATTPPAGQFVL
uniref:Protein-L-isoaspartate O-methyltransferase n=1 Tax=Candidatus Kentrum sp. FM TaxID=2126340 RepID=A0A450RXC8_9GAMM|nr:MAG: protein-L-isoaspartate(D-aspartate) O-methyltransferase [Candidatus Kentron sp. FM]VFJ61866.1 MAG: protein-L-isoaspartate(D-aspartate) O-methyltransferase [Candidatus Kentron sp. FM]VFK05776.1 MAG: protein-L-isoaspartate(D-aspartate) O-methyltransferase [Candidatus Kentron sp. FM]